MLSLSNILKVNSISSGATGLLLSLFPNAVADIFGVTTTAPFTEVGIFLVLFALFVFTVSTGKPAKAKPVSAIVALDTLWVIASIIAIFLLYSAISVWGTLIIAGVALWVALMAYLQQAALKKLRLTSKDGAFGMATTIATLVLCFGDQLAFITG